MHFDRGGRPTNLPAWSISQSAIATNRLIKRLKSLFGITYSLPNCLSACELRQLLALQVSNQFRVVYTRHAFQVGLKVAVDQCQGAYQIRPVNGTSSRFRQQEQG